MTSTAAKPKVINTKFRLTYPYQGPLDKGIKDYELNPNALQVIIQAAADPSPAAMQDHQIDFNRALTGVRQRYVMQTTNALLKDALTTYKDKSSELRESCDAIAEDLGLGVKENGSGLASNVPTGHHLAMLKFETPSDPRVTENMQKFVDAIRAQKQQRNGEINR